MNDFLVSRDLFPQLNGIVYADWTGAAIPPAFLIRNHANLLCSQLLGNPHSHHSSSARAMNLMVDARKAVITYFNADPKEYDVIWTSNASSAILLLQHYMWQGGELLLSEDNHNTMNGLREVARCQGADVRYSPLTTELTLDENVLHQRLRYPRRNHNRIFGYPAKSNYTGIEHSLKWHCRQSTFLN